MEPDKPKRDKRFRVRASIVWHCEIDGIPAESADDARLQFELTMKHRFKGLDAGTAAMAIYGTDERPAETPTSYKQQASVILAS